ncbi:hypothetical protein F511_12297 [Dorcoceras hygrometricum]|uniref:Uncharacterized protein n=1 Tax=Dorcoceras hygrometricum TaxID=472368 RepID=A0A2Z7BWX7_9LAMI|nr:hypothetical protein F511_12297 [Dorcoceras hygrometricum]
MSSSTASPVRRVLNIVDSSPESPKVKGPWLPDQAELGSKNAPWYEEKSSNLRSSNISFIKEKGGMFDNFEVVIPGPEDRAHLPLKGNPSSHKGWMSRFFFVRWVDRKRDPWKCDMSWRDNIFTLTPRTPERSPNLTSFLDAMREKSYNAPELIQEDLLYERMGKEEMLRLMEEEAVAGSLGAAAPSKKAPKKRRASTQPEKEARRDKKKKKEASTSGSRPECIPEEGRASTPSKRATEDRPKSPPVIAIAEVSSPKKKGPGRVPPLDYTEDWLVASPSGVVATRYICNMAPDRDIDLLRRADDSEAEMAGGGGQVVRRLTPAHRAVTTTRRSFDEAMGQHTELVARLEELGALRAQEQRAAEAREEALKDQLAETKAHVEEEAGRLKREAIHAWDLSKEEFLQSSEFDILCAKKALRYFKNGFAGCLAQFRANSYSEEEHPTSFLDAKKALMEMPDEEVEEEEEEQGDADATPRAPPSMIASAFSSLFINRVGRVFLVRVKLPSEEVPVQSWALVPSCSGLCVCIEELREYRKETGTSGPDEIGADEFSSKDWPEQFSAKEAAAAALGGGGGDFE